MLPGELALRAEFQVFAADGIAESNRFGNEPERLLTVISLFRLQVRIISVVDYSEPQTAHVYSQLMRFARNGEQVKACDGSINLKQLDFRAGIRFAGNNPHSEPGLSLHDPVLDAP